VQYNRLVEELKPVQTRKESGDDAFTMSEAFKVLRKLQRIRFRVFHRGKTTDEKEYMVKSFAWGRQYGKDGGHAKAVTFEKKDEDGKTRMISVYDYFHERYNVRLEHWRLPVIETSRGGFFPMEVCTIPRYNRYPFKLDSWQVGSLSPRHSSPREFSVY
jgi:eukaryotic translation initiation factor 2C